MFFKRDKLHYAAPEPNVQESAVRASMADLLRLKAAASRLALDARGIRNKQGGTYLSAFKGRGMEFDESRLYQPGDDIRHLDWRVMARSGKPHTKLFCEERERPVFLWVDYRAPMFFATRGMYKAVFAAQTAALLAWSANAHGDRTGGIIFSEQLHDEFKPRRDRSAVLRFVKYLAMHPAWNKDPIANNEFALNHALARLQRVSRPGSLIFLISDFRGLGDTTYRHLSQLARHNDIVAIFIYDPLEKNLPEPGQYPISDGHNTFILNTRDTTYVNDYQIRFAQRLEAFQEKTRRYRIFPIICNTTENPIQVLQRGLGIKVA